jgi:hypothetical protein
MHRAESDRRERSLRVTPEMRVLRMELASLHPTGAPNLVATPRVMETLPGPWLQLAVGYVVLKTEMALFRHCVT